MDQTNMNQNNIQDLSNNMIHMQQQPIIPQQPVMAQVVHQQPVISQQPVMAQVVQQPAPQTVENPQQTPIPQMGTQSAQQQDNNVERQLQAIPNVEQNKQEFIDNTQTTNVVKVEEKKQKSNLAFIIIIFVIIFAAIFLIFPYLLNFLG